MSRRPLHPDQIRDLHLDAAQPGQVTVTDMEDPHPASLPEKIPSPQIHPAAGAALIGGSAGAEGRG
ncbi:hypothetical protein Ssi02_17310 [Sinosporangium siamense]|uniref:Uncharacterized protein n=1 Tax=Sinosporangium siamense TaxID=1367973 RepID=A0A919V415_9ACTN|nr:hypothetical protein Ssi02_17310 [Sinosporangium siamense]